MSNYLIGNVAATELIEQFGSPLYVYDAGSIRSRYNELSEAFSALKCEIHYACKANESREILQLMRELGAGLDTVSPNEVYRALDCGYDPKKLIFTPSFPAIEELESMMALDILIHFDSVEYIDLLAEKLRGREIGVRINPAINISGNQKISTARSDSKFGIPFTSLDRLEFLIDKYNIKLKTLHVHTGSDVNSWKDLARSFDRLVSMLERFPQVKILDLGSGLKVKYKPEDKAIDLQSYAKHIENKLNELNSNVSIILEPGKFLVAEAGFLLTRVNMVKQGYNKQFVGVDSGFHHLIRPMYYDVYHHIINISNQGAAMQKYDVVGQLCEEDTFAVDRMLNEVRRDDILLFRNAGAYAYSMSSNYNLRNRPKELIVDGDDYKLITFDQVSI